MDHHMKICAFLPLLWAALYSFVDLPHRKCSYSLSTSVALKCIKTKIVDCYKVDLDIPNNFDVNLLPEDVQEISITCPLAMQYDYDDNDYCNTLRQNCTPVPFRHSLWAIQLIGFLADQGRIPLAKLLKNLKIRLNRLYIHSSKIGSLDADFLRGFHKLTHLQLKGNDIETLDINTFQSLVSPASQATGSPTKLHLSYIGLEKNKLQQLDWSVFRPLADCLEIVILNNQRPGLQTLLLSGPSFNLTTLEKVDFGNNTLTTMPREILQTIAINAISPFFEISVESNTMCSKGDCSCCEMHEFMRWAQNYIARVQRIRAGADEMRVKFSCGDMYGYKPRLYTLDRYKNCRLTMG